MKSQLIILLLCGILVGLLTSLQLRTKNVITEVTSPSKTAALSLEVQQLITNDKKLRDELSSLQSQQSDLANQSSSRTSKDETLQESIDHLKIISGVTNVKGNGVIITFDNPLADTQLIDLVNAIRNIGVDAIAINGNRIVAATGLRSSDYSSPVNISVIGDPEIMNNALIRKGGIIEQIGENPRIEQKNDIIINKIKDE